MRAILATLIFCHLTVAQLTTADAEIASCYGNEHGQSRTATGEHYNPGGLTAAHRRLPFGTLVRVTNLRTGNSVVVRINDRGPFVRGRDIDLSLRACRIIGNPGIARVRLEQVRHDYTPVHGAWGFF